MLNHFNDIFLIKSITSIIKTNKEPLLYRFIKILYLKKIVKTFKSEIHVKDIKILLRGYIISIQTSINYFIYDIFFYTYSILYFSTIYAL